MRSRPFPRLSLTPYSPSRGFSISSWHQNASRPQKLLSGKNCLITGASRGIGAEIARRFALEGARCTLVGRNEDRLREVRESLEVTSDDELKHLVVVGDVGIWDFWKGFNKSDKIDILVNAAGVTHYSNLFSTSGPLIDEVIRTNLTGTMLACRTVGKNMMASRKEGCIINVASLLALKGGKGSAAYAASKAGVVGLTRALAAELGGKGIRTNVIVPGYVVTDMTKAMTPEAYSEALNSIPLKRFGEASEIADAAMFLATNQYTNNCVLNIDGGLSAV